MKKVFIGSTSVDLRDYRAKVRKAVEDFGLVPVVMEEFEANYMDPVNGCIAKVDSSDIYVGIFAHRYGYCPIGSDISITEMEFNRATENGIPCFCFFVAEDFEWKRVWLLCVLRG